MLYINNFPILSYYVLITVTLQIYITLYNKNLNNIITPTKRGRPKKEDLGFQLGFGKSRAKVLAAQRYFNKLSQIGENRYKSHHANSTQCITPPKRQTPIRNKSKLVYTPEIFQTPSVSDKNQHLNPELIHAKNRLIPFQDVRVAIEKSLCCYKYVGEDQGRSLCQFGEIVKENMKQENPKTIETLATTYM